MKKKWWHDKAGYQIYPKSFFDANNDGIGDIPGIINKLDYLKDLGIDILWISPVFLSPMVDNGYDIADYYKIDPIFGTMEDMKTLICESKKRGIHLLMDLVVNHCSDQHRWFQEAVKHPDGKYGNYFYIKDGRDGKPPTNWRSYFGGSVWEKLPGYDNKYYLHSFAKEQPDLNWENRELREEIYEMIRWWLKLGLSGFRIDAIMNIKKDLTWSDLKPDGPDGMGAVHRCIQKAEGIGEFLVEMRKKCFDPFDAFTIGEAMDLDEQEIQKIIGDEGYFESIFAFEPCHAHRKGEMYGEYQWPMPLKQWKEKTFFNQRMICSAGFEANIIENHDQPRGASLFIPKADYGFYSVTALAMIIFGQRGMPFLYQGQEIGMTNRSWKLDEYNDLETINQYHFMRESGLTDKEAQQACSRHSRDNARTPMQWSDEQNAGFSKNTPWFVINENYKTVNVAEQEKEYGSVLNFYRRLIAFRKSEEYGQLLTYGDFHPLYEEQEEIFAYERNYKEKKLVLICNFSNQTSQVLLKEGYENVVFVNYEQTTMIGDRLILKPYEAVIMEKDKCQE